MVGGSGSLGGTTRLESGFLRRVKKPTKIGIRIKINATHNMANPQLVGTLPVDEYPPTSVVYGIIPAALTAPKIHMNRPGQPHNKTAAMVAIIATVRFSISFTSS
jgi:hypothetical protein